MQRRTLAVLAVLALGLAAAPAAMADSATTATHPPVAPKAQAAGKLGAIGKLFKKLAGSSGPKKVKKVNGSATRAAAGSSTKLGVSAKTVRKVIDDSRSLLRASRATIKRRWPRLSMATKACVISGIRGEFVSMVLDAKIDEQEMRRYIVWGPALIPSTAMFQIKLPIQLGQPNAGIEDVAACAMGVATSKFWKYAPAPV